MHTGLAQPDGATASINVMQICHNKPGERFRKLKAVHQ